MTVFFERVREYFEGLQNRVSHALEEIDGRARFREDRWLHDEGGGGLTRTMKDGSTFEKAGVNSSTVLGTMPETVARLMNQEPSNFRATGISLVIHPQSPMVPTAHANYRYFELENGDSWFGGGADLTPFYLFEDDILHFHMTLKRACDTVDRNYYPEFKKNCDEYFMIRHRQEARGTGGIFFDYLRGEPAKRFSLVQAAGDAFLDGYLPIVRRRMREPWGDRERRWQLLRRGRYVEFNLLYDRGTRFGLDTHGRVESILMSLPPEACWEYDAQPLPETRESRLLEVLKRPRDWANS